MSQRGGRPIDFQAWAQNQIVKRAVAALEARDEAFAERNADTPLPQLARYLSRCAISLGHSPSPSEVDGGTFIEQRFGSWAAAMAAARLPQPRSMRKLRDTARYKAEKVKQEPLFREERRQKRQRKLEQSEQRKKEQASSTHNALWNWAGVYTWCQETYSSNTSHRAVRGYDSARGWNNDNATRSPPSVGFRPVLEILNTDPLISDSDRNLGDKNTNFTIEYTVDDADSGDVLTATESLDGQTTKSFAPTRNLVNTISVDVDSLSLGKHTVKVVVSDGQGGTATRTWTFTRTNSAPTISGSDGNLGDKNLGFTYAYTIDDADGDTLTVVEELNDETIRTINNAPKGEELTVTITSEKLYALGLNSVNTLKITVTDGKGGTAYRRVTFKRTNSAPTISGQDKALGLKNGSFAENYTVSDVEGDNVVVTEFVDDAQIRSYQATLGQQETIELTREKWLSLTNGQHQLRIEAVDGNFATSVRVFSFSKKETVIKFELAAPEETDAAATKVLVTPTWKIEGAVAKVEACNNGFDAVPTWEDITAMVQINRVYNFTNKTKTASKWGVNIRFTITKNEGFEGEVSISGFGGAYE